MPKFFIVKLSNIFVRLGGIITCVFHFRNPKAQSYGYVKYKISNPSMKGGLLLSLSFPLD